MVISEIINNLKQMNNFRLNGIPLYFLMFMLIINLSSCEETSYRPADGYPDQLIYMPAAYGDFYGVYKIDNITDSLENQTPTPGVLSKYNIDLENRKFIVPLAVYRSGVNNNGNVNVDIVAVTDSISLINSSTEFTDELTVIPSSEYFFPSTVTIKDGDDIAQFNLEIDLDYMLEGYDTVNYAIGINVSSPDRESNKDLATTNVVVYSKILKAKAELSYDVDGLEVSFTNESSMAISYVWDFGDGSELSEEVSPIHSYPDYGTYEVILRAYGIAGDESISEITHTVTITEFSI